MSEMKIDEAKRLKMLEQENSRLKKLVADLSLDNQVLKEFNRGKILSPAKKRKAIEEIREKTGVAERRACRLIGQPRTTQRYEEVSTAKNELLVTRMVQLALKNPRYGTPRIRGLLRTEGWRVSKNRVDRLWRQEGLKVVKKQVKRRRVWLHDGSCIRLRAQHRNHVWSYDFVADQTSDKRPLRFLTVIDEYTRECLALPVGRSFKSDDVQACLTELFVSRGIPEYIRSDNGSEFTCEMVRGWLGKVGVKTLFIEPGSPWQNGYNESFNGKFRDEFLNGELLDTLYEAQVLTEKWRKEYNTKRPHSSLGYVPPAPEARLFEPKKAVSAADTVMSLN